MLNWISGILQLKSYIENELKQNKILRKLWPDSGIELRTWNAAGESFPTGPAGNSVELV